ALDHDADGVDVFARLPAEFIVRARTARSLGVHVEWEARNGVPALPRLRWHRPTQTTPNHLAPRRDFQAPLLSSVHGHPPCLYLLIGYTYRDCLSIPFVYTVGIWPRGLRTRNRDWGWSNCSARGAGAATSGCPGHATRVE